jgi:hypothetical protein
MQNGEGQEESFPLFMWTTLREISWQREFSLVSLGFLRLA